MKLYPRAAPALSLLCLAVAGCTGVKVVPTGIWAAPKPADCFLDFLEDPPKRPYVELGELSTKETTPPPGGPLEALRPAACKLGADAVIVTRDFVINKYDHRIVSGTAVKYRWELQAPPAAPAAPAPAPTPAPVAPAPSPVPAPAK